LGNRLVASPHNPGHRISLQGAWEPPSAGSFGWGRSFGRPGDLPAGERIDLVIVAPRPVLESVTLNARPLVWTDVSVAGPGMVCGRHDVTAVLARRNDLRLRATAPGGEPTSGIRGTLPDGVALVWLEIHGAFGPDHP
jgi:hypothetical protein